jgi:hypothetical protein
VRNARDARNDYICRLDYHTGAIQGDIIAFSTEVVATYGESQLTSLRASLIVIEMNTKKLMRSRRVLVSALLWTLALFVACKKKEESPPPSPPAPMLWSQIPTVVSTWVFVHEFGLFLRKSDSILEKFPRTASIAELRARWKLATGFSLLDDSAWALRGVDTKRPAVLFRYEGHWFLHVRSIDAAKVGDWLSSVTQNHERLDWGHRLYTLHGLEGAGGRPALYALLGSQGLFVVVPARVGEGSSGGSLFPDQAARFVEAWSQDQPSKQWGGRLDATGLRSLSKGKGAYGVGDPSQWVALVPARSEQAKVLRERIRAQAGTIAFGVVARGSTIEVEIRSVDESSEPVFVSDLGRADAELPMLGGLVEPGVLGVLRLSGSARNFYEVLRSSLEAEQRRELDRWFERTKSEFQIDVRTDVVDNLSGHLVVVLYGFSASLFREFTLDSLPELVRLAGTREAVLWTLKDGASVSRAIDIWTGLSKGKLRRQRVDDRVQYAWFDEGTMEWALLVDGESLIFVDGLAAFDHATQYQRSARPVSSALDETLRPLLAGRQRSGFYLDLRSLSALLAETDNSVAAAWIRPFTSVLLTTDTKEDGVTVTRIRFSLSSETFLNPSKTGGPSMKFDGGSQPTKNIDM